MIIIDNNSSNDSNRNILRNPNLQTPTARPTGPDGHIDWAAVSSSGVRLCPQSPKTCRSILLDLSVWRPRSKILSLTGHGPLCIMVQLSVAAFQWRKRGLVHGFTRGTLANHGCHENVELRVGTRGVPQSLETLSGRSEPLTPGRCSLPTQQ